MDEQKYYRAIQKIADICKCDTLIPKWTEVEETKEVNGHAIKFWAPMVSEPPIFWRSEEKVLCFSKTPGGAVIGAITGEREFRKGTFCICETTDKPDVDISHEIIGDFSILEEVRFHKPVETKLKGCFVVGENLKTEIEKAYGIGEEWAGFPNTDNLLKIRNRINSVLEV